MILPIFVQQHSRSQSNDTLTHLLLNIFYYYSQPKLYFQTVELLCVQRQEFFSPRIVFRTIRCFCDSQIAVNHAYIISILTFKG